MNKYLSTICIAGKGNIAVDVLLFCLEKYEKYRIYCILNKNEEGENSWQKSLKWFALKYEVPIISLEQAYKIENMIFLSTEFDTIVKPELFNTQDLYNIHFSLLPKYKGCGTSVLPILFAETETGVTLHKINRGIDTGAIIDQMIISIDEDDTSLDLYKKLMLQGTALVKKNLGKLLSSDVHAITQTSYQSTYFGINYLDYHNICINERQTAFQIRNQIRAFCFRPYQIIMWRDTHYFSATICDEVSEDKPGTVIEDNDIFTKIATIDYNILMFKDVLKEVLDAITGHDLPRLIHFTESPQIINEQDSHGWSPLIVAVTNNNLDAVRYLISKGANTSVCGNNGTTLLMYAKDTFTKSGDASVFEFLMDLGLDIFACDYLGFSLLDYCEKDHIERIGKYSLNDIKDLGIE